MARLMGARPIGRRRHHPFTRPTERPAESNVMMSGTMDDRPNQSHTTDQSLNPSYSKHATGPRHSLVWRAAPSGASQPSIDHHQHHRSASIIGRSDHHLQQQQQHHQHQQPTSSSSLTVGMEDKGACMR